MFIDGAAPVGRLGHTVVMIGPRVYVFGGHAHGEFFNDIWSFDLSTRTPAPSSTAVCNSLTAGCSLPSVHSDIEAGMGTARPAQRRAAAV